VKSLTNPETNAYAARSLIARSLIYVIAKNRSTGAAVEFGFWNGSFDATIDVIDGLTQDTEARSFVSKGAVLDVGDITLSDSLNVGAVHVSLSQLNASVESAIRTYDIRNAPIQIYRALFSVSSPSELIAPARCRFVGYVNTAPISTPPVGGQASVSLNCVSSVRELTRTNKELRSDEGQQRRHSGDRFFKYVAATGIVQLFWGQNKA
jgi:hypothetical protein